MCEPSSEGKTAAPETKLAAKINAINLQKPNILTPKNEEC